ncbi:5'-3'-deoxyribonucleotidase [Histomonas meleagridis]|uniref:5'-3'-deoxyribonucleotidase n=1 Tax=Histomonas meleagridis TaxID=135588 RepID=UPI00355956AF|nr:5'-3'-deoxyribonucleotidase [Histomonas meleagridis]KAH0802221.1 5'-3'-deoxyribonucleotidase [Histomonas meleagridis]
MKKKVILLDIDGTLNNFQEYFISEFQKRYPELIDPSNPPKSHIDIMNIDRQKGLALLQEPHFTEGMTPLRGAVKALHEMEARGHNVFFCTSLVTDHSDTLRDRVQWIGKWFGEKWMNRVIFAHDKTMVRGDFLVDDSPKKARGILPPTWKYIAFDAEHNQCDTCDYRIYDWDNLDMFFGIIEKD